MPRPSNDKPDEVLRVAAELFESRGYQGTSMDDVAAGVGLNKGTIYHYFPSKAVILFEIYSKAQTLVLEAIRAIPADAEPAEALDAWVRAQLHLLADHHSLAVVYFQEMRWIAEWLDDDQVRAIRRREREFTSFVTELVQRGVDDGVFHVADSKITAFGLIGMSAWTYQWYGQRGRLSTDDVAHLFVDLMLGGLRGSDGASRRQARASARA